MALLDYLRSHGNNPEMIQMVALKFAMFRELAKTRQEQAEQEVKSLRPKMLGKCMNRNAIMCILTSYISYL